MNETLEESKTVRSVERALDILECFSHNENELSLGEISNKINLPKTTVARMLGTLTSRGYVIQNENQRYVLGLKFFYFSNVVKSNINVRNVAWPIMNSLAKETEETVDLNILDNHERVCIEKIESNHQLRNFIRIGERNTLIYGASGKLLLSFQSEKYRLETFDYYRIEDNDFKTKLIEDMKEIRKQKYAFTVGERIPQGFAIAAPIFDYRGYVESCVTLAGPVFRLTGNETKFINKVVQASKEISLKLGYVEK